MAIKTMYQIEKYYAELKDKGFSYKPGITLDDDDTDAKLMGKPFATLQEAIAEIKKNKWTSDIMRYPDNGLVSVTEYMVSENEYDIDEDGEPEFISGSNFPYIAPLQGKE